MNTFERPTGKLDSTSQTAQTALVPADSQEVDEAGGVYGMVEEPMPLPPNYLFKIGHYMFWVGGIAIGNGGQCLTSIVSLMIWQYSSPVYFLASLAVLMGGWGWAAYVVEFIIRLAISAGLAILFQFGMALIPISTSGTWGLMLSSHPEASRNLRPGKKRFSILIIALGVYEVVVGLADIISDNQAASAITHDLLFKVVFTALLSIATLILTPAGFLIKTYAAIKMEELRMAAEEEEDDSISASAAATN